MMIYVACVYAFYYVTALAINGWADAPLPTAPMVHGLPVLRRPKLDILMLSAKGSLPLGHINTPSKTNWVLLMLTFSGIDHVLRLHFWFWLVKRPICDPQKRHHKALPDNTIRCIQNRKLQSLKTQKKYLNAATWKVTEIYWANWHKVQTCPPLTTVVWTI